MKNVTQKLMSIQTEIKAPKNLYNSFGKYKYRNAEGICEAVKPYLVAQKCSLTLSDDVVQVGERYYIKATATLIDFESGESYSVSALARESHDKKGQDDSQITGTTSSYARKYALNGLFLLDDTKDADTDEHHEEIKSRREKAEDEQNVKDIESMKIAPVKVTVIKGKCEESGIEESKVLTLYKLKSFEDMTEKQFKNAMDNWSKIEGMK